MQIIGIIKKRLTKAGRVIGSILGIECRFPHILLDFGDCFISKNHRIIPNRHVINEILLPGIIDIIREINITATVCGIESIVVVMFSEP